MTQDLPALAVAQQVQASQWKTRSLNHGWLYLVKETGSVTAKYCVVIKLLPSCWCVSGSGGGVGGRGFWALQPVKYVRDGTPGSEAAKGAQA